MNSVLKSMLKKYEIKNERDEINAMKEIIQEIVICGLSRGDFFDEAAFYGGTALRIFYDLDRFSEDLDFALLSPNNNFDLTKFFSYIETEVKAYGLNLKVDTKKKNIDSNIASAFLKGDTLEHILIFFSEDNKQSNNKLLKDIKIKFEVDINPPYGATYDFQYKLLPSPHQIRLYDDSSLFAGKIHAVLCRGWQNRIKGRDLYDYVFYMSRGIKVNMELIRNKLIESNVISKNDEFNIQILKDMLKERFKNIDYTEAKDDILPFIKDSKSLGVWNDNFFCQITDNLEERE